MQSAPVEPRVARRSLPVLVYPFVLGLVLAASVAVGRWAGDRWSPAPAWAPGPAAPVTPAPPPASPPPAAPRPPGG